MSCECFFCMNGLFTKQLEMIINCMQKLIEMRMWIHAVQHIWAIKKLMKQVSSEDFIEHSGLGIRFVSIFYLFWMQHKSELSSFEQVLGRHNNII